MITQNDIDELQAKVDAFIRQAKTDEEMLDRYKAINSLMNIWGQKKIQEKS
jgi:hypothetical protein